MILGLPGKQPHIHNSCFVANNASIIGSVHLGKHCSVWFGAVIRADNDLIDIGDECNIQDGVVVHTDPGLPMSLGPRVTVGHQAMLHGCQIASGSLIGIHSSVLNGARIGHHCLVGAGALITENKVFEDNSLILGAPARKVRELTVPEIQQLDDAASEYVRKIALYR
ncbi:MAG TPA: gamma carbonic anhydrase family protein [Gammaproteobacteria bacterium]|nr:gamma carbonic anhydrase family protein [Gammaproteobacteria bacterium]